ncbi:MAG: hypothetical protein JNM07_09455 [Phycisphaerae bacterium]|nr:hypothetical protein [Phycisphaerae bacterium]
MPRHARADGPYPHPTPRALRGHAGNRGAPAARATGLRGACLSAVLGLCSAQALGRSATPPLPPANPISAPPARPSATGPLGLPKQDKPEVVVRLKDGRSVTGFLLERTDERLSIRVGRLTNSFKMDEVETIDVLPPLSERYLELRAAIGNDPAQILTLVEWLEAREELELALSEAERAVRLDPANEDLARKKRAIERLIDLGRKSANTRPSPGQEPVKADSPAGPAAVARAFPLLSPDECNLIKVYEIDLARPPRLLIPRPAIGALIERHADSPLIPPTAEGRQALYHQSEGEQLELMFRLRARDLYGQVRVLEIPESLRRFRDDVHPWVFNSCATTSCHGGAEAGRLQLYNRRPQAEQTWMTNFIILDRFRLADGSPILNYEAPAQSALLQLALVRAQAHPGHPTVQAPAENGGSRVRTKDAWRPVFQSSDDERYGAAVRWLESMYRPRPDYGVSYTPPQPSLPGPKKIEPEIKPGEPR